MRLTGVWLRLASTQRRPVGVLTGQTEDVTVWSKRASRTARSSGSRRQGRSHLGLSGTHPAYPATDATPTFEAHRCSALEPVVRKFWTAAFRVSAGLRAVT